MPAPRKPMRKAALDASDKKNPQRFKNRKDPSSECIGDPPAWLKDTEKSMARTAWYDFADEIPWLNKSHTSFLTIAADIRGRQMTGAEVGVQALNLLRQCLGQMGATPSDATKVTMPDDNDEGDDLLD